MLYFILTATDGRGGSFMSINNHPDKNEETQRLEYTKEYIQQVIGSTDENKEKYKGNI
jgi:hypothetical protein